eukprot:jgi/Chrzof1/6981/Cz02g06130.t1
MDCGSSLNVLIIKCHIIMLIAAVIAPREEINELSLRPDTDRYKILLLLAWRDLYNQPSSSLLSWFQVAGIHGMPYVSYNGSFAADSPKDTGYCMHGSTIFFPWHRPYLAHLDKALVAAGKRMAARFVNTSERVKYQALAPWLRCPFWDWASDEIMRNFPTLLTSTTVNVDDPLTNDTALVVIDNPFYQYTFKDAISTPAVFPATVVPGDHTFRKNDDENARETDIQAFLASMQQQQWALSAQIVNFLRTDRWECTYTSGRCGFGLNDMESIHGSIHGAIGGTMLVLASSSYDPIFWFHHAFCDKLLWLWQQNNPDVWVSPNEEKDGTFYLRGDQTFDQNTPLAPFWKNNTHYMTSNDVKDVTALHYTYDLPFDSSSSSSIPRESYHRSSGAVAAALPKGLATYMKGYWGYRWQINFRSINKQQLGRPFFIHVLINTTSLHATSMRHSMSHVNSTLNLSQQHRQLVPTDLSRISSAPNYCGSHYALSGIGGAHDKHSTAHPVVGWLLVESYCL